MHVKICGMTSPDDGAAAAASGADFIGLILAPSTRQVTVETARRIRETLPPETEAVLVYRDAPVVDIGAALVETRCTWVQLHGHEPITQLKELRRLHPDIHLIRAWEVSSIQSGEELAEYLDGARREGVQIDVVLLDAPKGSPHPGYECLAQVSASCTCRPPEVWCAGGLTPANLAAAVAAGHYDGVDVASGVESKPGVKDHAAVRAFVAAARQL